MFFVLSKVGAVLMAPPTIAIVIIVLSAILSWTAYTKTARLLLTAGAISLVLLAFSPLQALVVLPLENRFPPAPFDLLPPTGIIVLGGVTDEAIEAARGQVALNGAAARLTAGAVLANRYPKARLVFTGGSGSLWASELTEAESVRRLWTSLGVPQARALYENKSRNTWENAIFTGKLLEPKPEERWLLVTSAMHMPRSVGLFRKAGFSVIPYPTDYKTLGNKHDWEVSPDPATSMANIEIATHEWIGLFVYWLTGKIDALLPGPD